MPIDLQKALSTGSFSTNETSERDEFSAHVGWTTEYLQLEPGQYHAEVDFSIHGNIRLAWSANKLKSAITGTTPADHLAVFLPLHMQSQVKLQGRFMRRNELAFLIPNSKAVVRYPGNFEMITIAFNRDQLDPKAQRIQKSHPELFIKGVLITKILNADINMLVQICKEMIEYRKLPFSAGLANSIRKIELQITTLLSDAIVNANSDSLVSRARNNRVSTYYKARDYINGRLGKRLGIEAIAAEAGVSPRTLEYAFQDCLGISALKYIKTRRLAEARRLLLAASPAESSVSDIANACGIRQQGHFAREYCSQFLELPSQTLKNKLA